MRQVIKLIRVSLEENGVNVKVDWIRSPHEIEETRKKPQVFVDIGSQVLNFEESILAERKRQIGEKLRRRKQKKSKNYNCLGYIPSHTFLLVHEDSNGQFRFELTPDVVDYINDARSKYENYKSSSHYKSEKSFFDPIPKKSTNQQPKKKGSHIFNEELKKLIDEYGKESYLQFYSMKDPQIPSLKAMSTKSENFGFRSVNDFMKGITEIKNYYKDKDQSASKKADEMYYEFKNAVENNKIIMKYEEQRKKKISNLHSKKNADKSSSSK